MRSCAKMRCGSPAEASAAVRYGERIVLIEDIADEDDPNLLDLCADHAGRLTPPRGWRLVDGRAAAPVPVQAEILT